MSDPVAACVDLLRREGATAVYLFGSRARGDSRPDSDIDLAALGLSGTRYYRLLSELWTVSEVGVDLVLLDEDTPFARHVRNKIERGWAKRVG